MMRTHTVGYVCLALCALLVTACSSAKGPGGDDDDGNPPDASQGAVCGDAICDSSEVNSCTADCGGSVNPVCGNNQCEQGETTTNCPNDCKSGGPICGDGTCDMAGGENSTNCPGDCNGTGGTLDCNDQNTALICVFCLTDPTFCMPPTFTEEACAACGGGGGGASCGDLICDPGEDPTNCPSDCP